ncbi:MAG TPA: cysteine desulfurase family protein [Acidimicrobiales bacterium]|nr:cysteine desulfurase family protein [Acidimicrobiales bacterium]
MPAYLDHAATTPLRPEAAEAMRPFLDGRFGNPSGSHAVARAAKAAIEEARDVVADCLGCRPHEVVFTGGGTEADNLAVLGAAGAGEVACSAVEHHAVLHAVQSLGGRIAPVGADGIVQLDGVLDESVSLLSVMLANNETGTVQPLDELRIGAALLHTDAVHAFPWIDVRGTAADLVSVSAHKFGGPQGVGALVVRDHVKLQPTTHGGGQERDLRSGTHNVVGIVGMVAAMQATVEQRAATNDRVGRLRDRLADGLLAAVPGAVETGDRARKTPGNCHIRFEGVESEALLVLLDDAGVYASAGSACASGAIEPSHVLTAMGLSRDEALSAVRFSLGWNTTDADVDLALAAVPEAVGRLR